MAKAIFTYDTTGGKKKRTEWASSTKDGIASRRRIYGDVRVADDENEKRVIYNHTSKAGETSPAVGIQERRISDYKSRGLSAIANASSFEEYVKNRKAAEEAEGMRSAAEKLAGAQGQLDSLMQETMTRARLAETTEERARREAIPGKAMRRSTQLMLDEDKAAGSWDEPVDDAEKTRRAEAQAAAEALMENYGYKKVGSDKAVFATPFSPLPAEYKTKAEAPAVFGIKPGQYAEALMDIDRYNSLKAPERDAQTEAFMQKYFPGFDALPTAEEYNDAYERMYNDWSIPDEEVRAFWEAGQEVLGKAQRAQDEYDEALVEARDRYDAARQLLGPGADEAAGGSVTDYYTRYGAKLHGQERPEAEPLSYRGYGSAEDMTLKEARRYTNSPYAVQGRDRYDLQRWSQTTEEERAAYQMMQSMYGEEAAEEYMRQIEPELNKRLAEAQEKESTEWAEKRPLFSSLKSVLTAPVRGAGMLEMAAERLFGKESDPYDPRLSVAREADTIRNTVAQNAGDVGGFLYQTGMSIVDNLANMAVWGGLGSIATTVSMGAGSAASAYNDAIERGASSDQAMAAGALSGIAEAVFESFSLDNVIKMAKGNGLKTVVGNIAKQMGIEGSEELFTGIANEIADRVVMGDISNYALNMDMYMQQGMQENAARRAANKDMAKEIGLGALGGVISGGVMGGGAQALNAKYGQNTEEIIQQEAQEVTAAQPQAPAKNVQQPEPTPKEPKTPAPDVRDALMRDYAPTAAQDAQNEAETEADEQEQDQTQKPAEGASEGKTSETFQTARGAKVTDDDGNTSAVTVLGVKSVSDSGLITLEVEDGSGKRDTVSAADVSFDDANTEELIAYAASGRMDAKAMRGYLDGYDESIATAEEYAEAYTSVYSRARGGVDYEQAALGNAQARQYLTRDAMIEAYAAGENAYNQVHDTGSAEIVSEKESKGAAEASYSIKEEGGRRFVEVDTDQEIFEGKSPDEYPKIVREYIKSHFRGSVIGDENNRAYVDARTGQEYTNPANHRIEQNAFDSKMRAGTELHNLVSASSFDRHNGADPRHPEFPGGFDLYKIVFRVAGKTFEGKLNIGIDDHGRKRLYDLTQIKSLDHRVGVKQQKTADAPSSDQDHSGSRSTSSSGQAASPDTGSDTNSIAEKSGKSKGKVSKRYSQNKFNRMTRDQKVKAISQMELLSALATRTGRTIAIVDEIVNDAGEYANASYDRKTGEIRVALDADENAYAYAAVHELVHALKNEHKSQWKAFRDFVFDALRENGKDVEQLVAYQMERFGYSRELAEEEVVCNTVPAILKDERNVLKLYKGSRALFERVVDWVKDLLSDIQKAGELLSQRSRSWAQMDALKGDREKMQKIYDEMMRILAEEGEASGKEQTVFSMKETVEETRDLLAVHNLTEENMRNAMELGGLAMPSIAVIKAEQGHSEYGPISVVFDKSTIDPNASSANEIYGGDAWTPTFPQVEYEVDDAVESRIQSKYYQLRNKVGDNMSRAMYSYANDLQHKIDGAGSVEKMVENLLDDTNMMQLYLADKGMDTVKPVVKRNVTRMEQKQVDEAETLVKALGADVIRSYRPMDSKGWMEKYGATLAEAYENALANVHGLDAEVIQLVMDDPYWADAKKALRNAYRYLRDGAEKVTEETDYEATGKAIRDAVDQQDYKTWLNDLFAGAIKGKGIRNDAGTFTPSGKRRSFKQTHWDVTLDNVVRAMRKQEKTGVGMLGRSIEGAAVKKYSSIKDVKADSDRLRTIPEEEYERMRKNFRTRFRDIASTFAGNKDPIDAGDVLVEYITKKQTADGIYKLMQKDAAFYKPSRQVAEDLAELVDEMKNAPTGYFEAKPRRAVGFGEMAAVIVPDDISNDVRDSLKKAGVNLIEYKAGNEADRLEKMNSEDVDRLRFSMRDTDENVQSALTAEAKAFAQVKGHRIMALEADKLAGQMLKLSNSDYDRKELAARLSRTFSYAEQAEDIDMQQIDDEMTAIAADVMNHSRTMDLEHEERMKPIRDYLRTTKIRLSNYQRDEAANMSGSYGAYRKSLFGRVKLVSTGGIGLETAWSELNELDAAMFPADVNETDMPKLLQAAVDAAKPVYHTGMGMNADESVNWLAGKMTDAYFALPAVQAAVKDAKTFGDSVSDLKKALKQFEDVSWSEYQNALEAIKKARTNEERTKKQQEAAALRKKYQEWRAKDTAERKERELKNKYRSKIERTTMALSSWMLKPTDAKHVPAGVEDSVRRMLETLDFTGKDTKTAALLSERLNSLADAMANAQEGQDESRTIFLERDQQMIDEIKRVAELIRGNTSYQQMEGRGIYDLNSMELKELSKWLDVIRHNVTEASKLRGSSLPYESVEEAAQLSMMEMSRKKAHKDKKWITKTWNELYGPDMQDSFTFFERLGPTANQIFRGLREGFDKVTRLTRQAEKHTKEILKDADLTKLTGKKAKKQTFELASGEKIEMTKAQLMELYVLDKREQARGHLYGDGIRIQGDDDARAHKLRPAEVKKMTSSLTAEEKRIADGLQKFLSRECANWGNETSMRLLGYRKFGEETYWPIRTDSNTRNTTRLEDNYAADINAIKNQGMTKQTIEGAKNAIVIGDIFDTYTRHISNMAAYAGYALPLSDFTRWFNSRGVKTEIEQMLGKKGLNYINNFLMAVNGSGLREEQSGMAKAAGWLSRNAKIASVGANMRVAVQQPTSYARAAMYMSPKYLSMGLKMKKPDEELVNRYCGIAQWKRWGFYETNIGPNLRQMIVGDETTADKMREIAMKPAAMGDNWTLNHLWNACVAETRAEYGYKEDSEAFYEQVGRRLSEIIDRTQVVDSVFHRSQMMRSKNAMNQMLTNFMSEPTKTYNMLMSAISDYADNRKNKAARNRVARALVVYGATGLLTAAAAAVVDAIRDDDAEKEWLDKYTDAARSNVKDNLNPLGLLPGVNDVLSLLEGYEPSRLDQQSIQRIIWAAEEIKKYVNGTSKQNLYGVTYKTMQAVSSVIGVPVSNLMRDANALIQSVTGETPTLTADARSSQTISHVYDALSKGDKNRADKLREELRQKAGMTPKEIDTALAEKLMGDELVKTAWEAKQARNYGDMNRAKNALTAKGFTSETVDKAITRYGSSVTPKEVKEKDPNEELNVTLYSEEEVVSAARILAGVENGGSVTEADVRSMISERVAGSDAKDPEKSVKSGIQTELKKDYLAMEAKGDTAGMHKVGMVMENLLGTSKDDMEQWVKDQHADNLRTAVDSYNSKAAQKAVQVMRKDGKTDSEIKQSLKKYKQLYMDAMNRRDTATANKIKNLLISLGLKGKNGKPLYDEETFSEWMKK